MLSFTDTGAFKVFQMIRFLPTRDENMGTMRQYGTPKWFFKPQNALVWQGAWARVDDGWSIGRCGHSLRRLLPKGRDAHHHANGQEGDERYVHEHEGE